MRRVGSGELAALDGGAQVGVLQWLVVPIMGRMFDPPDIVMYALGADGGAAFEGMALSSVPRRR